MPVSRRRFLKSLGGGALGAASFLSGADRLFQMNAWADPTGGPYDDYKALVCVFLYGGNDANNMVIPYADADYQAYKEARGNLAFEHAALLPLKAADNTTTLALHPNLTGLQSLWAGGKLAILSNVGPLVYPFASRNDYLKRSVQTPYQLFSHSDQQAAWQSSDARGSATTGWGGRLASYTRSPADSLPNSIGINDGDLFNTGIGASPLVIPAAPTELSRALTLNHPGDQSPDSTYRRMLENADNAQAPTLVRAAARVMEQSLQSSTDLSVNPTITQSFSWSGLGNQLLQAAKLIKFSKEAGIQRQVICCSMGGFDTHINQGTTWGSHAGMMQELGTALAEFYAATEELKLADKITTFTMSEFGRTLKPNGEGGSAGTDHAWGGHHFIVGGAVRGNILYGRYPQMVLGDGDDADNGSGARGRWIPSTSVDQYAATLARWFGVSESDLLALFPNLKNFDTADLGFMA
ncbi:MAG: DUF1501 domain-containing protein [Methylococcaceae bacterium]|nr:DUF1501 domain-containing protein [Methylococcaceae bacterium]